MNRTGTFERAIRLHQHLLTGKPLSISKAMEITDLSRAQIGRYMIELERLLPIQLTHIRERSNRKSRAIFLEIKSMDKLAEHDEKAHAEILAAVKLMQANMLTLHGQHERKLSIIEALMERNDALVKVIDAWRAADSCVKEFGSQFSQESAEAYEKARAMRDALQ
jgi:DNA-binding transcriptional regulator GbsR (MarR family)